MDLTLEEFTNSAAQWDGKCDNQARAVAGQDRPSCPGPYTGNTLSLSHPFAQGKKNTFVPSSCATISLSPIGNLCQTAELNLKLFGMNSRQ